MAYYLKNRTLEWVGASTDTKPTSGVPVGSLFYETDTKLTYIYSGAAWSTCESGHDLIARKAVTFINTAADVPLFTVTGTVIIKLVAVCITNLASAGTCTIGVDAGTAALIVDTACTLLAAGEIWHDVTPDASVELTSVMKEYIIANGVDISLDLEAAHQVDSGVLEFYCIYIPLSANGAVVAA